MLHHELKSTGKQAGSDTACMESLQCSEVNYTTTLIFNTSDRTSGPSLRPCWNVLEPPLLLKTRSLTEVGVYNLQSSSLTCCLKTSQRRHNFLSVYPRYPVQTCCCFLLLFVRNENILSGFNTSVSHSARIFIPHPCWYISTPGDQAKPGRRQPPSKSSTLKLVTLVWNIMPPFHSRQGHL